MLLFCLQVNNAGIPNLDSIQTLDMDKFDEVIRINVWGYILCINKMLPHLLKTKGHPL